ncbi:MAG: hypothetical protein ACYC1A_12320 [Spirochaetales bacterium]
MKIESIGKPQGCKLLRITADLSEPLGEASSIESISIRGDFFAVPEELFEAAEARLIGTKLANLSTVFDGLMSEMGVQVVGISGTGLLSTLKRTIDELSMQDPANRL